MSNGHLSSVLIDVTLSVTDADRRRSPRGCRPASRHALTLRDMRGIRDTGRYE
jgi:hypothetical protein